MCALEDRDMTRTGLAPEETRSLDPIPGDGARWDEPILRVMQRAALAKSRGPWCVAVGTLQHDRFKDRELVTVMAPESSVVAICGDSSDRDSLYDAEYLSVCTPVMLLALTRGYVKMHDALTRIRQGQHTLTNGEDIQSNCTACLAAAVLDNMPVVPDA